jgi:hypothetical protein
LIVKCWARKRTKKRPESAITTFLAMEDFINPLIRELEFVNDCPQNYSIGAALTNFEREFRQGIKRAKWSLPISNFISIRRIARF